VISDHFKTCLARVKKAFGVKGLAAEVNAVLEEFEHAVAEIRGEQELLGEGEAPGGENVDGNGNAEGEEGRAPAAPAKAGIKGKTAAAAKQVPAVKKTKTAVKKRKVVVSSDEESEEEDLSEEDISEGEAEADLDEAPLKQRASSGRKPLGEVNRVR
jgi:hypothetical protein